MGRKTNPARQEARKFVGSGELRGALEQNRYIKLSEEAINVIVNACSFVLKV